VSENPEVRPNEDDSAPRPCPICRRAVDVVTFSCPICNRDGLCFYHRRDRRAWRLVGRRVVIPECCAECFSREHDRLKPQIRVIRKARTLEIVGGAILSLMFLSLGLLFVRSRLAVVIIVALAGLLALVTRFYFRLARSLPEPSDESEEDQTD
jgi:hypothetical protein